MFDNNLTSVKSRIFLVTKKIQSLIFC